MPDNFYVRVENAAFDDIKDDIKSKAIKSEPISKSPSLIKHRELKLMQPSWWSEQNNPDS